MYMYFSCMSLMLALDLADRNERVTLAKGRSVQSQVDVQQQARRNVAKMLIAVVVVFALCYFPVHALGILRFKDTLTVTSLSPSQQNIT